MAIEVLAEPTKPTYQSNGAQLAFDVEINGGLLYENPENAAAALIGFNILPNNHLPAEERPYRNALLADFRREHGIDQNTPLEELLRHLGAIPNQQP